MRVLRELASHQFPRWIQGKQCKEAKMDPFEKVVRQLLDNLETRLSEARTQGDERRYEIVTDILKDLGRLCDNVLAEEKR